MAQRFLPYWVWVLRPPLPNTGPLPRVTRVGEVLLRLPYVSTRDLRHPQTRARPVSLLPMFQGRPEEGFLRYDGDGKIVPSRGLLLETEVEAPEAFEVRPGAFTSFYLPPPGPHRAGKPAKGHFITMFRWNVRGNDAPGWRAVIYVTPPLVRVHEDRDPRRSVWAIPGLAQRFGIVYVGTFHTAPWALGFARPILDEWGSEPLRSFHVSALPPRDLVKLDELLERGKI